MINFLRKHTPKKLLKMYHYTLAKLSSAVYGNPSGKLIVIGVTGTNGKSTTVNLLGRLLDSPNSKTGFATTANFKLGDKEWINETKMTMLGRFQLQKFLSQMVKEGCHYAIIETSSQGIEQYRHLGINYDYVIFTNLTPEHIEAHGGFENYKKAKGKLFSHLTSQPRKLFRGREIEKKIIVNLDDPYAHYYLQFPADRKIGYTLEDKASNEVEIIYTMKNLGISERGMSFNFEGVELNAALLGKFNAYNLAAALSVAIEEKVDLERLKKLVNGLSGVPGRMEFINEGQNFSVLVDYAPEPESVKNLYEAIELFPHNRLIHVLGSCGGGRDVARRPILGQLAASKAELVVVTNEDPYDDSPEQIINEVAQGARDGGKEEGKNLFIIQDRAEAIRRAISMAQPGDLVLITGKGCEQFIMSKNGTKIAHDDREVAREALGELTSKS